MSLAIEPPTNEPTLTEVSPRMRWRHSLGVRLGVLITALVATVLALFMVVVYRELSRAALRSGGERSLGFAVEVSNLLAQSASRGKPEMQRLAADRTLRDYLNAPTEDRKAAAEKRLVILTTAAQPPVVLLSPNGEPLLQVAPAAPLSPTLAAMPLPSGVPSHSGVGPLLAHQDTVYFDVVVGVYEPIVDDSTPSDAIGFVVLRRVIQLGANTEALKGFIGAGARLAVGNRAGGVWTDFNAHIVPPPKADATRTGIIASESAAAGVGGVAVVEGTPWAVSVEIPRSVILAPATALLARMLIIGVGFVIVAAVVVAGLSRHATKPLNELTLASEAIAAGEYSRRIQSHGKDEVGRLGVAFNTMADRVERAHRDLEERVQQRTALLEETSAELDRFFELSPDMLCIANMEGRLIRVNHAWQETLGWTPEELTAVPYSHFVHPDDVAATDGESTNVSKGVTTRAFENRYRCKDGTYRVLSWRAAPIVARGLVFAAARDVTEKRRTARELEERAASLAMVNQELEAFTYSVSHDLRAPLRHITGFATLLEESASAKLDDGEKRRLKKVTEAATRMGQLIDDLLEFSRMGRSAANRHRVNLDRLLRDTRQELAMDPATPRVTWTVHPLPEVLGDEAMLKQVLVNLVGNAIKYTRTQPAPAIEIGSSSNGDGHAVIYVRDNGVGFDMQYSDKLFGVFQRLHNADAFEGTGIGLASVRRIVNRHGGRAWAEGAVNQGATFYLSLPRWKEDTTA